MSDSLFNLALGQLCSSIVDENGLQNILNSCPPPIAIQIVLKVLNVNMGNKEFVYNHTTPNGEISSLKRGELLTQPVKYLSFTSTALAYGDISYDTFRLFAKTQQTKYEDKFNFCNNFNLDLFFKFVGITSNRCNLFTIFQICVQHRGFKFPKELAMEWITTNNSLEDDIDDKDFRRVEQGLALGIFLGDSGWFIESALVLSYTYEIITNEWMCADHNLKLTKTIECLTGWLLALTNCHHFKEAKIILEHIMCNISVLKGIDEKICLSYAYIAVSQYYFILMEFNQSWLWIMKAVDELDDNDDEIPRLMVISHAVKVCSVLNKLDVAKKLINQLHTYDKVIQQNIHVDMLLNEAWYLLKADLAKDSIFNYYNALDSRRNLFGFYNLHTAIVFTDYAYARYVCDYSSIDYHGAMRSILQSIFIMEEIGLPKDNMLLINAGQIKALILEEKAMDMANRGINILIREAAIHGDLVENFIKTMKNNMLKEAECLHLRALDVSLDVVGKENLLTAKSYCNLGRLYQSQENYQNCEKMHLMAIEVKESILGKEHPDVALSLGHLASMYTYQLGRYEDAETLYLRSKTIYENSYGHQYTGLLYNLQGLVEVYRGLQDQSKCSEYMAEIMKCHEMRQAWLDHIHVEPNLISFTNDLSVKHFKCILNECDNGCEQ